jgi:hypothetical protein
MRLAIALAFNQRRPRHLRTKGSNIRIIIELYSIPAYAQMRKTLRLLSLSQQPLSRRGCVVRVSCRSQTSGGESWSRRDPQFVARAENSIRQIADHGQAAVACLFFRAQTLDDHNGHNVPRAPAT